MLGLQSRSRSSYQLASVTGQFFRKVFGFFEFFCYWLKSKEIYSCKSKVKWSLLKNIQRMLTEPNCRPFEKREVTKQLHLPMAIWAPISTPLSWFHFLPGPLFTAPPPPDSDLSQAWSVTAFCCPIGPYWPFFSKVHHWYLRFSVLISKSGNMFSLVRARCSPCQSVITRGGK